MKVENHSNNIKLRGLRGLPGSGAISRGEEFLDFSLDIPRNELVFLKFSGPALRGMLVYEGLLVESQRIFNFGATEQGRAVVSEATGICPTIDLFKSVIGLSKQLTLAELFGLDALIEKVFFEKAKLYCEKHDNEFVSSGAENLNVPGLEKLSADSGVLALTKKVELGGADNLKALKEEFERDGIRKVVSGGRAIGIDEIKKEKSVEAILTTFSISSLSVERVRESISSFCHKAFPSLSFSVWERGSFCKAFLLALLLQSAAVSAL